MTTKLDETLANLITNSYELRKNTDDLNLLKSIQVKDRIELNLVENANNEIVKVRLKHIFERISKIYISNTDSFNLLIGFNGKHKLFECLQIKPLQNNFNYDVFDKIEISEELLTTMFKELIVLIKPFISITDSIISNFESDKNRSPFLELIITELRNTNKIALEKTLALGEYIEADKNIIHNSENYFQLINQILMEVVYTLKYIQYAVITGYNKELYDTDSLFKIDQKNTITRDLCLEFSKMQ